MNSAANLDTATTNETAFHSFADMERSCRENGYRPTIDCETEDARLIAGELEARGYSVYRRNMPAPDPTPEPPRRVKLTPAQADRLETVISEESRERFEDEGVTFRRTFVEGPVDSLHALAMFVLPEDAADDAAMGSMAAQSENEVLFCQRSAFTSAKMLEAKLEGRTMTLATARRLARKAIF